MTRRLLLELFPDMPKRNNRWRAVYRGMSPENRKRFGALVAREMNKFFATHYGRTRLESLVPASSPFLEGVPFAS